MIDTDKIRAALAATPLCQNNWTKKEGNNPTMLCAVSAMVSFAGVQPDLIDTMANALGGEEWFRSFARPVLLAEYGIPSYVAECIPRVFDRQENEWRGVTEVLALCEQHNMDQRHAEAINEDAQRFPQHTCAEPSRFRRFSLNEMGNFDLGNVTFTITGVDYASGTMTVEHNADEIAEAVTKTVLPKPAQKYASWLGKKHKHAHKALGY
jgi:hypothetical protein